MKSKLSFQPILLALCLAVGLLIARQEGRLLAQAALPTPVAVTTPEGITANQVNVVARELWCPLCNGVRLDACELKACAQMRDLIAIKLGAGEDSAAIKQYFVDFYGPQVLGAPPLEGFNWLAWLLPPLVLLAGGILLVMRVRRMTRPAPAVSVPAVSVPAVSPAPVSASPTAAAHATSDSAPPRRDDYTQLLEDELQYE